MWPRGSEMKLKGVFLLCVDPKGYSALHSGSSFLPQSSTTNSLMPRMFSCLLKYPASRSSCLPSSLVLHTCCVTGEEAQWELGCCSELQQRWEQPSHHLPLAPTPGIWVGRVSGDGATGGNVSLSARFFYLRREKQGGRTFPGDLEKGNCLMLVLDFPFSLQTSLLGLCVGWASLTHTQAQLLLLPGEQM